jgi:cold shock CspA family protein
VATGAVVRFDSRRGYGFLAPDDGGEDVFVHQNNINMEGFRYLQVGERVSYELEVGEKGMKAVSVSLLEPRIARGPRPDESGDQGPGEQRPPRVRSERPRREDRQSNRNDEGKDTVDKLRRRQERLINLLVEKGLLTPGEIDSLDAQTASASAGEYNG